MLSDKKGWGIREWKGFLESNSVNGEPRGKIKNPNLSTTDTNHSAGTEIGTQKHIGSNPIL